MSNNSRNSNKLTSYLTTKIFIITFNIIRSYCSHLVDRYRYSLRMMKRRWIMITIVMGLRLMYNCNINNNNNRLNNSMKGRGLSLNQSSSNMKNRKDNWANMVNNNSNIIHSSRAHSSNNNCITFTKIV